MDLKNYATVSSVAAETVPDSSSDRTSQVPDVPVAEAVQLVLNDAHEKREGEVVQKNLSLLRSLFFPSPAGREQRVKMGQELLNESVGGWAATAKVHILNQEVLFTCVAYNYLIAGDTGEILIFGNQGDSGVKKIQEDERAKMAKEQRVYQRGCFKITYIPSVHELTVRRHLYPYHRIVEPYLDFIDLRGLSTQARKVLDQTVSCWNEEQEKQLQTKEHT